MRTMATCVLLGFLGLPGAFGAQSREPVQLFMPDGQIKSRLLRVFVTRELSETNNPQLQLSTGRLLLQSPSWSQTPLPCRYLARDQSWVHKVGDQEITTRGTLLLFDLRDKDFPFFKPTIRVDPILMWDDGKEKVFGERQIYVGNLSAAAGWAFIITAALLALLSGFARNVQGKTPLHLLAGDDGRLSLARVQIACWTAAIGYVILCFSLMRLETPEIPEQLVALMGMSLATGGLSYVLGKPKPGAATKPPKTTAKGAAATMTPVRAQWSDLICTGSSTGATQLSIAKAQMVFWTGLMLILFITKSLLDGELWPVPWELLALMGFSQAGYVSPKFKPGAS